MASEHDNLPWQPVELELTALWAMGLNRVWFVRYLEPPNDSLHRSQEAAPTGSKVDGDRQQ